MNEAPQQSATPPQRFTFGLFGDSLDPRALGIPAAVVLVALLLMIFGIFQAVQAYGKIQNYEVVTGTVVRIEGEGSQTVSIVQFYTKEGFSETAELHDLYPVGKEVKIFYNPQDVTDVLFWSYASLLISPFLIIALGLFLSCLGAAVFWSNWQRKKVYDWLVENGVKVSARVVKVLRPEDTLSAKVRSGHGLHTAQNSLGFNLFSGKCRVVASWYDRATDTTREFCSEPFVNAPPAGLGDSTVDVYYARGEAQVYYVDLSSIKIGGR